MLGATVPRSAKAPKPKVASMSSGPTIDSAPPMRLRPKSAPPECAALVFEAEAFEVEVAAGLAAGFAVVAVAAIAFCEPIVQIANARIRIVRFMVPSENAQFA